MKLAFRAVLVCLGLLALACARTDPGAATWLSEALTAHRQADVLAQQGDLTGARELLRRAAERESPRGADPRDARIVRQDLFYRVAELELASGDATAARAAASRGLELGRGRDVFTSNLLIVRGRALEAVKDLSAASRDYHDALLITDALLDERLDSTRKAP